MKPAMSYVSKIWKERMYRNYILNAPYLFSGIYKIACMVIDKRTQAKINITSKSSNKQMFTHISKHQLEKRFGGELEKLQEGEYWPPRYRNTQISLDEE